jgi:hypothetical protein
MDEIAVIVTPLSNCGLLRERDRRHAVLASERPRPPEAPFDVLFVAYGVSILHGARA